MIDITQPPYCAAGDGQIDDTAAIQAAIDALANQQGGAIYFPRGCYLVRKDNPTGQGTPTPDDMALRIYSDNITLFSDEGAILKHDPSAPRFKILRVGVTPITNGLISFKGGGIKGLEFDGSYTPDPNVEDDGNFPLWVHGVQDYVLRDLYIHHSSDYGIGMQNGGHKNVRLENITIEDVMADGIDVKNNGNTDAECKMRNITVRRFGRGDNPTKPFAGIDLMGEGWLLSDIHVSEFGDVGYAASGVRFKQGETTDEIMRGLGAHHASMTNFCIRGSSGALLASSGVDIRARNVVVGNGQIRDCPGNGVQIRQHEAQVSNVLTRACGTGFKTETNTGETTDGIRAVLSACVARSSSVVGFDFADDWALATGCMSRTNPIGVRMTGNSNKWSGQIGGCATPVVNTGTGNVVS